MSTPLQIQIIATPGSADPTSEEAAAAVAVIMSLMAEGAEQPADDPEPATGWRDTAKLVSHGLAPSRAPARAGWGTIERIRRAGKGGSGITGL
ncbi:hypothetical protein K2Z83_03690 [Oscillochloris sp. ZM17-4]|uniref:hypothetical protein n=1 Tax=Oscillochloris sp. ZM17-4 TaxID=2866714 RepID=UPI001C72CAB7|nr:hypothetical protein [Oscillochloris sp. ZM17-4]MBX0326783.1 hypothetical protein [Oscillochloris sp. ZM17-4]